MCIEKTTPGRWRPPICTKYEYAATLTPLGYMAADLDLSTDDLCALLTEYNDNVNQDCSDLVDGQPVRVSSLEKVTPGRGVTKR